MGNEQMASERPFDIRHYVQGRVALEMNVPARGPVPILSLGPGDLVGWSALIGGGRMTATARATEDSEVVACAAKPLLEVCGRNAEVGYVLMRQLAVALSMRLVATRLQLLDLFGDPREVN